jgi:hypothetical protein
MTAPAISAARAHERQILAVHEAGHAVVMIRTGLSVRYATLAARDTGGAVVHGALPANLWWRNWLAISAAGAIAELAVNDNRDDIVDASREDLTELREDARRVWRLAQTRPRHPEIVDLPRGATVLAIAELGWAHAHDLVVAHFAEIQAVAAALLASRRALTGRRIREIADAAAGPASPGLPSDAGEFWPTDHLRWKWAPRAARTAPRAAAARQGRPC